MKTASENPSTPPSVAEAVRRRIDSGGERIWRLADFRGLPFMAVAQSLSRLAQKGTLQRIGKGLYYRPRPTVFGPSKPNLSKLRELPMVGKRAFPSGLTAANLLGFTTQNPAHVELSTDGLSLPRQLVGQETIIHTRRPESWRGLSEVDAALLDFLRHRGETSELSPKQTVRKLLKLLAEAGRFVRLTKVATTEPPRVRAILGAVGQQLGVSHMLLSRLRNGLNPLSRFDFGILRALKHASEWQAKERHICETG